MTLLRCPRCDLETRAGWCCGLDLLGARPFHMTTERIRAVHVLKARKGLDEDTYRVRLQAVGVDTHIEIAERHRMRRRRCGADQEPQHEGCERAHAALMLPYGPA